MKFEQKIKQLKNQTFDKIVSIGVRCIPALTLVNAKLKQETLPFDWVQSNPQIVLDCIKDEFKMYNNFNHTIVSDRYDMHIRYDSSYNTDFPKEFINEYGMCFTHYTDHKHSDFIEMSKRRTSRFMELLKSDKRILFIYMNDKEPHLQEKQYSYLLQLEKYLVDVYPKLDFKILSIHNISTNDTDRIINLQTIHNKQGISIEGKHFGHSYDPCMLNCIKTIFKTHPTHPQQKVFQ